MATMLQAQLTVKISDFIPETTIVTKFSAQEPSWARPSRTVEQRHGPKRWWLKDIPTTQALVTTLTNLHCGIALHFKRLVCWSAFKSETIFQVASV